MGRDHQLGTSKFDGSESPNADRVPLIGAPVTLRANVHDATQIQRSPKPFVGPVVAVGQQTIRWVPFVIDQELTIRATFPKCLVHAFDLVLDSLGVQGYIGQQLCKQGLTMIWRTMDLNSELLSLLVVKAV
ncbi:hypothetical protein K443DRAFT_674826 [Laccaria amethystina LaAM-08-1]|uniref:Uncharacterized protein n=1 Tax=Laccaria amethystina LaAM-08-1 TaxID=1095629 RepID=A0A0C9YC65_9AGAR|nr:hypothetical protein K443DRAFT_674826 [Laccaria amethystina LaAM-08-1]